MEAMQHTAAQKAAVTYNAAADHFDDTPLAFWGRHGRRAVDLLALQPGEHVLDVGCGTGASAIPAAVAVGPTGHVTGWDVAENMLERARAKADARGLDNLTLVRADMSSDLPDAAFDAVVSVFSIFFVPEMERQVGTLWRALRPGGRLAVTVWGPRAFEPAVSIFAEELERVRPDMSIRVRPWERLTQTGNLAQLLRDGGTAEPEIYPATDAQMLRDADDWWTIATGSGFRGELDQLSAAQRAVLRTATLDRLTHANITAVETNAIHAIARKP